MLDPVKARAWLKIRNSFLRSLLPVAVTYTVAVLGFLLWGPEVSDGKKEGPGVALCFIIPLFTFSHGVGPVFLYYLFMRIVRMVKQKTFTGFVFLHMVIWYGIPTFALAAFTGWILLPAVALAVAFAPAGTRIWTWLEYGSTSLSLILLIFMLPTLNIGALIFVVASQILLLTLMDWKGRALWVKEDPAPEGQES